MKTQPHTPVLLVALSAALVAWTAAAAPAKTSPEPAKSPVASGPGGTNVGHAVTIADFRQHSLPEGWQVEGYAFGSRAKGPGFQETETRTDNQRQYGFGPLTSPEFVIERPYMVMELGGTYHPEKLCAALMVGGKDVRRVSVGDAVQGWVSLDTGELMGKKAQLQIRDRHFNGWLELGQALQTDAPRGEAQKSIPAWEPKVFETKIEGPYLLLPLGDAKAPIATVTIEIAGKEKLSFDMPLAMGSTENLLPVYDLRDCQGQMLRVRYSATANSSTAQQIRISAIPAFQASDNHPAFHIHCRFGKLNDPNGLVYHGGQYHLFHQYFIGLRGKYWAHFVSTNLVHWQQQPVALFPDELGSMHSGSAAVDVFNTAGFQHGDQPAIIAALTGSRGNGGKDKVQLQGIAWSADGGRTFNKYAGNPVIGMDHFKTLKSINSRDPKIFWYSPTLGMDANSRDGHWVMVLYEDLANAFFTSPDLKVWTKRGSLSGFAECPELFSLPVDGNPKDVRWVTHGAKGEYHVGQFDGESFKPETTAKIRFNFGNHYYAAQVFNNTPGDPPRRIKVGWERDQLSFPVDLTLKNTALGLRVCALPVPEITNLYSGTVSFDGRDLKEGDASLLEQFHGGLYDIECDANVAEAKLVEFTIRGQLLSYDVGLRRLKCDGRALTLPEGTGRLKLRILVDNCSLEIFAGDGGLFYMPMFFGPLESKQMQLQVQGGPIHLERLRVHELRSIWARSAAGAK